MLSRGMPLPVKVRRFGQLACQAKEKPALLSDAGFKDARCRGRNVLLVLPKPLTANVAGNHICILKPAAFSKPLVTGAGFQREPETKALQPSIKPGVDDVDLLLAQSETPYFLRIG